MPKTKPPAKPHKDFPLFPHAAGVWAKKIRQKLHYFGPWADPQAALEKYLAVKDDLLAGRTPRPKVEGITIADLCNKFLTVKKNLAQNHEIRLRTYETYFTTCRLIVGIIGKDRLLIDLGGEDFDHLRRCLAKTRGPVALGNEMSRVRMAFKFAFDAAMIDRPIRYGPGFKPPSRKVLRVERAKKGPRMFEAADIRRILDAAPVPLKAMMLLGLNCGFGNSDCASLPIKAVDLDGGWIDYARPKTGIPRRIPLWPETVAAVKEAIADRPRPKDAKHAGLVFITSVGRPWSNDSSMRSNPISAELRRLLKNLGTYRPGLGFYAARHTFQTIGQKTRDKDAVRAIMGHTPAAGDMSAVYNEERIDDARLVAVVSHVHEWLFGTEETK